MEVVNLQPMRTLIKKIDDELQIVYGEVYAPNVPDADTEFMTAEEIRKMAHKFMAKGIVDQVDMNHNNIVTGSVVVESFIVDWPSELYILEAWVVGVHIPDADLWAQVKSGELNGFSMEAMVKKVPREIELEVPDIIQGHTLSDTTGHTHVFSVRFDDQGNFLGGGTDIINGHVHDITRGTVTDNADGHNHRFSIVELMENFESA